MPRRNLVNAGLYVIKKSILRNVKIPLKKPDIAKNLFPKLLKISASLYGYVSTEYIKDMGTPDRLGSVKKDIRIPGFATLHDYYQHEFRKRADIEYDC